MSTTSIIVKMQSDGTMVRIKTDGTEEKVVVPPVAPLSDEAVTEAALRDPDAQPLTDADLARMKRVPRVKTLRRAVVGYFPLQRRCTRRPLPWEHGHPDRFPSGRDVCTPRQWLVRNTLAFTKIAHYPPIAEAAFGKKI